MNKNVLIPLPLFKRIRELLIYWDISNYDRAVRDEYRSVKSELDVKLHTLLLREAYSKILQAKNEDDQHSARMEYLHLRNISGDLFADDFDS